MHRHTDLLTVTLSMICYYACPFILFTRESIQIFMWLSQHPLHHRMKFTFMSSMQRFFTIIPVSTLLEWFNPLDTSLIIVIIIISYHTDKIALIYRVAKCNKLWNNSFHSYALMLHVSLNIKWCASWLYVYTYIHTCSSNATMYHSWWKKGSTLLSRVEMQFFMFFWDVTNSPLFTIYSSTLFFYASQICHNELLAINTRN